MTADSGEATGEDKDDTQRQGPPMDMVRNFNRVRLNRMAHGKTTQDKMVSQPTNLEDTLLEKRNQTRKNHHNAKQKEKSRRGRRKIKDNSTKACFPRDETTVGLIEVPGALAQQAQAIKAIKRNKG